MTCTVCGCTTDMLWPGGLCWDCMDARRVDDPRREAEFASEQAERRRQEDAETTEFAARFN